MSKIVSLSLAQPKQKKTTPSDTGPMPGADFEPSVANFDLLRYRRWRPEVVMCVCQEKNVLLAFSAKYDLWQIPQGGIESGEQAKEAIFRELSEELGADFAKSCSAQVEYLSQTRIQFPKNAKIDSEKGDILGKHYFIFYIDSKAGRLALEETQFDQLQWCSYDEAASLFSRIYQPGKKRLSLKALEQLKLRDFIQ